MSIVSSVMPYVQIGVSVLLIITVLFQQSGSANGGALGGADNTSSVFHTRRGLEKALFISTIILGILFAVISFVSLIR